jgi:anti-sigma factor RsiW
MTCKETQFLMDGYLDRELDLIHSIDLERHLHECPECAELHRARVVVRAAMTPLRYTAPAALKQSVREKLDQAGLNRAGLNQATPRRRFQWQPIAALAAAAAIALVIFIRPDLNRVEHEVVDSHIRSLMPDHLMDVPSTDQHTVKPWFAGKLDFSPPVQDFTAQGFPLIGGRIDYFDNHPAAVVVYRRNKHVINLFAWPTQSISTSSTLHERGYNIVYLARNGMEYWIVSDLNSGELGQFANLAVR